MNKYFPAARLRYHWFNVIRISRKPIIWLFLFGIILPLPVFSDGRTSAICNASAQYASLQTGVPVAVLMAISLTETGRSTNGTFAPWPWTVNMEGKGDWFDSREQAQTYAIRSFDRGARSFDVGCFQLNYKWHHQGFSSIQQMFDPKANALYAANFLRRLHNEKGNWVDAAGAYHSRTPKYANRYKTRFAKILARQSGGTQVAQTVQVAARVTPEIIAPTEPVTIAVNSFPLLHGSANAKASLGSLMPANAGSGSLRLFEGG